MIANPVLPPGLLVVIALALGGFAVWRAIATRRTPRTALMWISRLAMVLLLVTIAARPTIPGDGQGPRASGGLEVWFVVDTTSSIAAEDWGNGEPRLDGIKADIEAIAGELTGAQFSLITFDVAAVQRVPLTIDSSAVVSAADVLRQEVTVYSRGSSIDEAVGLTERLLQADEDTNPGQRRVLFYLGDGEQTSDLPPGSFESLAPFLEGGAVLGYGTDDGGRMLEFSGVDPTQFGVDEPDPVEVPPPAYILDPETGAEALSIIDEAALREIAAQLGVPYLHRTADTDVLEATRGMDVGELTIQEGEPAVATELYWLFAIPLGLLALLELVSISGAVLQLVPRRRV